ncbi:MAG: DNA-3-methyladenine glycosylase [Candidatus Aenigmatarchaeota archaeon]
MKILKRKFFEREPKIVAIELLGKILVRKINGKILKAEITETEAYYGKEDPASRVYLGKPKYVVELMHDKPGKLLIYMVHSNWLLNVVAHEKNKVGAVLIRAVKPLNFKAITNGPGKLTKALKIDKSLNGIDATIENSPINFINTRKKVKYFSSKRIGVKKDLDENLRFYVI